jgi:large subunit ribosomal protein L17
MLRNLASSLFLTERDAEDDDNAPKVPGRVVTTLHKAKEVRPLVERCITIARHSLQHAEDAEQYATSAKRNSDEWRQWRSSDKWRQWCDARAPVVAARRRALQLLGDKEAVRILFDEIAPRFADRDGGYTRVLKLATPRLGDAGERAILEFVGVHDRIREKSEKPAFADDEAPQDEVADSQEEIAEKPENEEATAESEGSDAQGEEKKEGEES